MIAAAVDAVRPARHHVQQRRHPDAPARAALLEDHTVEDFERLIAVNFRGVFLGCKHAVCSSSSRAAAASSSTPARSPAWSAGAVRSTARPRARCTSSPGRSRSRARRSASGPTRSARRACRFTGFMAAGGHERRRPTQLEQIAEQVGAIAPARPADHRRGLRRGRGLSGLRPGGEHHRRAAARRRRVRRAMTRPDDAQHCSTSSGCASCSTCAAASSR